MKIMSNNDKRNVMASSNDPTTTNLADFGMREIEELRDILTAWLDHGLPDDFYEEDVVPMFNRNSGNVFLTNSDYQVAMLADGKLESWYYTPYSGYEGFLQYFPSNQKLKFYLSTSEEAHFLLPKTALPMR